MKLPIIESLILSSPEPLPARRIGEVVGDISPGDIDGAVNELNEKYRQNDLSFRIRKVSGGYQIYVIEDYKQYVDELLTRRRTVRMTRAALECLAIIAYRQPVTKMDIEMIRGVSSDSVIRTLLERKLITLAGRAETIGRPLLYRTTAEFLKFFGLFSIDDLPRMSEIEELMATQDQPPQADLPFDSPQPPTADDSDKAVSDSPAEQAAEPSDRPEAADNEKTGETEKDEDETEDGAIEETQKTPESADIDDNTVGVASIEEK